MLPAIKDVPADSNYRRRTGYAFMPADDGWVAGYKPTTHHEFDWCGADSAGAPPLIAAMRAFALHALGEEVDL